MTGRQRHLVDLGRIPRAHNQTPARRISFHFGDHFVDLIDARAVFAPPIAPLRAINAAEFAFFIGPFVPNAHAMLVEITNVGIAAQKPEQLVNNRFDVQLLRREQRKSHACGTQIEARLRAEDRQCAGTGAIGARLTLLEHKPEKIMILAHAKNYRGNAIRQSKKSASLLWWQPYRLLGLDSAGDMPAARVGCRSSLAFDQRQLFFELLFALVQRLQTQLPAMQLNVELVEITGGFGSL